MSFAPDEQHRVQIEALSITRLVAVEAEAQGLAPDQPEADAIHERVLRMPHHERVLRLYQLGGDRTDDLWMGLGAAVATYLRRTARP